MDDNDAVAMARKLGVNVRTSSRCAVVPLSDQFFDATPAGGLWRHQSHKLAQCFPAECFGTFR